MAIKKQTQRPPIVAILGHVDHGKTSLLDRIRKTNLIAREAGGITQSIGAWQIETKEGKKITFIDTPGHEAFSAMRSRGAQVADLVVLVVAADDGVMPQTRESLKHIQKAKAPFLVAITKVDLKTADPEKAKSQLVEEGVLLEGRGGDVVSVEVSSKTGKGIDELLEMIGLLADLQGIKGDPEDKLQAPVVESELDSRRGPVVHVIVRTGTLKIGDEIFTEGIGARVRGLFDENRKPIKEVLPGMPAEILGFAKLPPVGAVVGLVGAEKHSVGETKEKSSRAVQGFPVVLKADTVGSLEAVIVGLPDSVGVVSQEIGDVADSDVLLAATSNAPIVGFNVKVPKSIAQAAQEEEVKIYTYKVIYELLSDVERWIKEGEDKGKERVLGKSEIIAEFPHNKKRIAGSRLLEGRITKADKLRLIRDDEVVGRVRLISLKKGKEQVDKVEAGAEFGILFEPQLDFKVGDVVESYIPKKEARQT